MTQLFPQVSTIIRPLRDYQQGCIMHTINTLQAGERGYYALPTGTGKTRIATALVEHYSEIGRVLVIAHRKELIQQMRDAIANDTGFDVGVCMAEQNDTHAHVIVGSIQTLSRGRIDAILANCQPFAAILIDECHHVIPGGTYATIIEQVQAADPDCIVIGCTATPYRSDKARMQDILPECTFTRSIADMQRGGWLSPLQWQKLGLPVNLAELKTSSLDGEKDYQVKALEELISPYSPYIVERTAPMIADRPTIVFAASVKHAHELTEYYWKAGVRAMCVWGDMDKASRTMVLDQWKRGQTQVVVNVGVLTEGFDYQPTGNNPHGLCAMVIARPTMSPSLYIQMLGRGTRLKPDGSYPDCLVIDVCGNANLLETKQITLPRIMPDAPEDFAVETMLYGYDEEEELPELAEDSEKVPRPVSLKINDPVSVSWCSWGWHDGIYTTNFDRNTILAIYPDSQGTGLYQGVVCNLEDKRPWWNVNNWQVEHITPRPKPLQEIMQHFNHLLSQNGAKKLVDKNAKWRNDPPSEGQMNFLSGQSQREYWAAKQANWTKGEVSHALTWHKIKKVVEGLASK